MKLLSREEADDAVISDLRQALALAERGALLSIVLGYARDDLETAIVIAGDMEAADHLVDKLCETLDAHDDEQDAQAEAESPPTLN